MANREINEVKINGVTMISTREDTVTKETLLKGVTAHDASGEQIVGELDPVGQNDAYLVTDEEGELADNDYLPFYDSSEGKKKKSLFSHLVDKLKSIFVTISGNTVIEGQELSLKTEVDASKPDNDVEDIYEATLSNILDKEGRIINSMGVEVTSDGKIGTGWIVKNYNTDGQTIGLKGISFSMDKQGNLEYTIADEDAFREAIKTIDQIGTAIPENADLNDYTTAGVYYVNNATIAASLSNLPYNGAGKLVVLSMTNSIRVWQMYYVTDSYCPLYVRYMDNNGVWYSWIRMANSTNAYMLQGGVVTGFISENDDLNNYTTAGIYDCRFASIASTLSNCPVTDAFKMMVDVENNHKILTQTITIIHNLSSMPWRRTKNNSDTWSAWYQYASTSDITPSSIGNGYAVATISGSAITATIDGFQLRAGAIVALMINTSIFDACTLNISGTGAKSVQIITGSNPSAGLPINYGINTFMYDGTYYRHIAHNFIPSVSQQGYVADTSGNIVLSWGYGTNRAQIKYYIATGKIAFNYYKNSTWRGDRVIADYDDIVHQTLGTDIPDNADFNGYTTNGIYCVSTNARALTLSNRPCDRAGKLMVMRVAGANYITQIYFTYGGALQYYDGIYRRAYDGSAWGVWLSTAWINMGNNALYVEARTTTAEDKAASISFGVTDTTTNQRYNRQVLKAYQDHQATPTGFNLVMDGGGNTIIGSGESAQSFYGVMASGTKASSEHLFLFSDSNLFLESNANTIANRQGFVLSTSGKLLPVKAETVTDNFGDIGESSHKLANLYVYKINGATPATSENVIVSNQAIGIGTALTSLDDIPLNTAGRVGLAASISPTGDQKVFQYICYGDSAFKTIELTRVVHDKLTNEKWYQSRNSENIWTGWMPLSRTGTYVGTCTTAAATKDKEATVDADFSLKKGVRVAIKFTNTNTYSSTTSNPVTLNVNNTGAKYIYVNTWHTDGTDGGTNALYFGTANRYIYYLYDGTYWVWDGTTIDNNTTYSPQSLGIGYGTNTEAATVTARAVTLSNYNLTTNGIIAVKFTNAVPAGATLNVNGKGAKSIYYRGVALKANVIKAGDVATFIYSGQYHLLGIDRTTAYDDLITGTGTAAQDKGSGVSPRYFPAKWTFDTGRTATAGDIITIKIPVAGHDYGVFVSVDNGSNYIPVALNGTGRLTTHFPINQTLQLVYEPDTTVNSVYPVAGGDARVNITGVWRVLNYRDNDTVDPCYLGFGYATCATAAATAAKVATLSNYTLRTGGYVSVKFTNAVPANATLNINSRGAKNIYYRGAAIKADVIKAGDLATFIYSGQYHLVGIDRTSYKTNTTSTSAVTPNTNIVIDSVNISTDGDMVCGNIQYHASQTLVAPYKLLSNLPMPYGGTTGVYCLGFTEYGFVQCNINSSGELNYLDSGRITTDVTTIQFTYIKK